MSFRFLQKVGLRCLISFTALTLVFWQADMEALAKNLSRLNGQSLLVLFPAMCISWLAWSWRLQTMQPGKVSLATCFLGFAVNIFGNVFLPFRGGDAARCLFFNRTLKNTSVAKQLALLLTEKIIDLFSVAFVITFWAFGGILASWLSQVLFFVLVAGLLFATMVLWSSKAMPKVTFLRPFIEAQQDIRRLLNRKKLAYLTTQTAVIRLCEGIFVFGLASAIDLPVTLWQGVALASFVSLGMAIPAAPGAIGTYEATTVFGLSIIGIDRTTALSFALFSHAWFIAIWVAVAVFALITLPVGLKKEIKGDLK